MGQVHLRGYRQIHDNRVLPRFGKRRVDAVTRADVQTWVTALHGEGISPATVHHHYVALKKAFRFAQQDRLIAFNPCDGVKLPKAATVGDFAPTFLTAAEVERVAARLAATRRDATRRRRRMGFSYGSRPTWAFERAS